MWCNPGSTFRRDRGPIRSMPATDGRAGPDSRPDLPRFLAEHPCAALSDEIEAGNVRALVSFGGNPLVAIAEPDRLRRAIESLDVFAVIGTMHDTQIDLATHVLPAAGGLERAEVLLSSQSAQLKVIAQYAPAVVPPQADRRPSWWIIGQLARRLGHEVLPGKLDVDTATDDDLLGVMVGGREVLDEMKAADGPLVGEDRVTDWALDALPDGWPQLAPPELVEQLASLASPGPSTGAPPPAGSFLLVPRRRLRRFNSVAAERGRTDEQEVLVHTRSAAAAGLEPGGLVRVTSAHGELVGTLTVTEDIDPGVVAISHGYVDVHVGQLTSTSDGVDPLSGQIAQTAIPVVIDRV